MKITYLNPKVGDTVTLNEAGIKAVFGTLASPEFIKPVEMKVTGIEDMGIPGHRAIDVDNPTVNRLLVDNTHFTLVRRA